MEKQKNSRKKTLGKRFKLALALTPAILIMAVILVVPLASAQLNAPVPLQTSSITGGNPSVNSMASTLGGSGGGMSLAGNMTVTGNSTLNGQLTLTNAEQVILGSPLFANGTMTL
nr:hypothetical protein [Candidatus Freyarchaeota archaeon]